MNKGDLKQYLQRISPRANKDVIEGVAEYLPQYFQKYGIITHKRLCHFLAQSAHETDGFRTLEEYASGKAYEGRKDLGNVNEGDGVKFKGRGIFQLTGRYNYRVYGEKLNMPLEQNPDLVKHPQVSVLTALEYWNSRKLSEHADRDDIEAITKRINGGLLGLAQRKAYYEKAIKYIPQDFFMTNDSLNIVMAKKGDKSSYVKDLQQMLVNKGYNITVDGDFGPNTERAVKHFQQSKNLEVTGMIDTNTINKLLEM